MSQSLDSNFTWRGVAAFNNVPQFQVPGQKRVWFHFARLGCQLPHLISSRLSDMCSERGSPWKDQSVMKELVDQMSVGGDNQRSALRTCEIGCAFVWLLCNRHTSVRYWEFSDERLRSQIALEKSFVVAFFFAPSTRTAARAKIAFWTTSGAIFSDAPTRAKTLGDAFCPLRLFKANATNSRKTEERGRIR